MSDNAYSRFVQWAKIILPLAALALLSTLFLLARSTSDTTEIPYATIEEIARQPRLSAPRIAGTTSGGDTFAISASVAKSNPDNSAILSIEDIAISLDTAVGQHVGITAGAGHLDTGTKEVLMENLVRINTSDGYLMETIGATADLASGRIETSGRLEVRSPIGQLTAGKLVINRTQSGNQQMVFNEGVRLIYQPQP